jgi:hypothetical protein
MKKESHVRTVIENSALIVITATTFLKGFDVLFLDSQPLLPSNQFWWIVNPEANRPDCFDTTVISIHSPKQGESVTLYTRSFNNTGLVGEKQKNVSGKAVSVDRETMCLPLSARSPRQIVFQFVNGSVQGDPSVYTAP